MADWRVPLFVLELDAHDRRAMDEALASGWLSAGPRTRAFEEAFAQAAGTPHAVAVSSGTAALHLALKALDIGAGDEVVVPSLTFVATPNAVVATGARPVFADIDAIGDPCVSAVTAEAALSERSRAVIAVHYAGMPCEMGPLRELCAARGIPLIEDAAHAPGARLDGSPVGSLATAACFSFFANKNLTTIEGGMITTGDASLARRARALRSHGMTALSYERFRGAPPDRDVAEPGFNYRLDELRAALGMSQLERLAARNRRRLELLERYAAGLAGVAGLGFPFRCARPGRAGVAHLAALVVEAGAAARDALAARLAEVGIQTSHHYQPAHRLSAYRAMGGSLPRTERFSNCELTLPLWSGMPEALLEEVVARIRDVIR